MLCKIFFHTNCYVNFGQEMYLIHLKVTNLCRLVLHFDLEILKEECFTYNYTKFQLLLGAPLRDLPIHLPTTYIALNAAPPMNFNFSFFSFFPFFRKYCCQLTSVPWQKCSLHKICLLNFSTMHFFLPISSAFYEILPNFSK